MLGVVVALGSGLGLGLGLGSGLGLGEGLGLGLGIGLEIVDPSLHDAGGRDVELELLLALELRKHLVSARARGDGSG